MALHAEIAGNPADSVPLVLLHGFGGCAAVWNEICGRLPAGTASMAYDLPGHALSLEEEPGGAGRMAKAILADLDRRGLDRVHLSGHSLGGAVAALMALRHPARVASLTLLAPGGFGPEINGAALAAYGSARTADDIRAALLPMTAEGFTYPEAMIEAMAEARSRDGALDALDVVFASLFARRDGGGAEQGMLPVARLGELVCPVRVLWGTDDRILPIHQSRALPANVAVTEAQGIGHMLIEEAPGTVAELLRRALGT